MAAAILIVAWVVACLVVLVALHRRGRRLARRNAVLENLLTSMGVSHDRAA